MRGSAWFSLVASFSVPKYWTFLPRALPIREHGPDIQSSVSSGAKMCFYTIKKTINILYCLHFSRRFHFKWNKCHFFISFNWNQYYSKDVGPQAVKWLVCSLICWFFFSISPWKDGEETYDRMNSLVTKWNQDRILPSALSTLGAQELNSNKSVRSASRGSKDAWQGCQDLRRKPSWR